MKISTEIDGIKVEFELLEGPGRHPKAWGNLDDATLTATVEKVIGHENESLDERTTSNRLPRGKGDVAYIGYDCEWQSIGGSLVAQSYQFYFVGPVGEFSAVLLPTSDTLEGRLAFKDLLAILLDQAIRFGCIAEPPKRVLAAGYFLRADLAMLSDLVEFKQELDNVGGSIATAGKPIGVEVLYKRSDLERKLNATSVEMMDGGERFLVPVSFADMMKHDPEGKGLFAIGELVGEEKAKLRKGYTIDKISQLKRDYWDEFVKYGVTDAKIAIWYYLDVLKFTKSLLGKDDSYEFIPATAGSLAVQYCRTTFQGEDLDFEDLFGVEEDVEQDWSNHRSYPKRQKVLTPNGHRAFYENFAIKCYLGGRNETFYAGPSDPGVWHDYDLIGAYVTAMALIREIDYSRSKEVESIEELIGDIMGFAWVRFEFPPGTRYPSLPVRTKTRGLIFPLKGESYCTSPEIELAKTVQGAKIELIRGVVYPWKGSMPSRFFVPFVQKVRELRSYYNKSNDKLREKYAKLIGNSLYGKTGQGLKEKNVFNSREMDSRHIPPSMITNAPVAALITGMVRATVGEMLHNLPAHRLAISVTTDGILTDATPDELNLEGPICSRYRELVSIVTGGESTRMVEEKHQLRQVLSIRTRGLATLLRGVPQSGAPTLFLAKSSISPPEHCTDPNDYIVQMYFDRYPGQKTMTRPFVSIRDQWIKEMDVFRLERLVKLNMEYDMKRRPIHPRTVITPCGEHVAFETEPWQTAAQAVRVRAIFDEWRETRCLKSLATFDDWEDHYLTKLELNKFRECSSKGRPPVQVTEEGSLGILKRLFLRAYVRGGWGLKRSLKGYAELQGELERAGLTVTEHDAKNGNKGKVFDNVVPRTPRTEVAVTRLRSVFQDLDVSKIFIL